MFKKYKQKINYLIKLGRYDNPTGALLLMWPCFWGALAQFENQLILLKPLILFLIGSFIMRGAGCCINDLFDRNIDKLVERTKSRPLAQNKLTVSEALIFIFIQLFLGLIIILQFDSKIIALGFFVIPLVIIYPLVKRFSYFPQFILGLVFNWGIFIGYISLNQTFDWRICFLYFAGVFLTISYDTIYGFQDIDDDKKIGVKSFSILIEKKSVFFISLFYLISFIFFISFFFSFYENSLFNVICCFFILIFFFLQISHFEKKKNLIKIFKSNAWYGGFISLLLFLSNYL